MNRIFFIPVFFIVLLWANPAFSLDAAGKELHQQAEQLRTQGKYSECLRTYEKLLDQTTLKHGENNVKAADVLIEMSLVYRYDLNDEKRCAKLQERAKSIQLTLNGVLHCRPPDEWSYEKCRERWLGPDPCFIFRNGNDYIKVTYYGLEGSRFKKPDDFIKYLKMLFGKFPVTEKVKIDGMDSTRIKLRYEHGNDRNHHGIHRLPEFLYEEFLILSLNKGFLVFNLNLNHYTPMPLQFTKDIASDPLYGFSYNEYQTWVSFTGSCKINRSMNNR